MKRRFEFVGGSSAKFYEVEVVGCSVTIRFGRIGTPGQTQTKTLPVPIAAERHADKLVGQKLGKGYTECVAS